jgi:hypothetical protein
MESLLGHGEASKAGPGSHPAAASRKARNQSGWIPAEGGPLAVPTGRVAATFGTTDDSRFAVESQEIAHPPATEGLLTGRELELTRKLHEVLASPLGEGVAMIVEESFRLLPLIRHPN